MTDEEIRAKWYVCELHMDTPHPLACIRCAFDFCYDALETARRERDEAVAELENDQAEEHQLILRQGELLTGVVNALRGDPAPLYLHSHHDAAELASEVLAERDEALAHIAELESQGAPPWK